MDIFIAGSSNGRTAAFEAVYLGSNPSPAAKIKHPNKVGVFYFHLRPGFEQGWSELVSGQQAADAVSDR